MSYVDYENQQLRAENTQYAKDTLRLLETIKYLVGIAERGTGTIWSESTTAEQFVLGYVKRLETRIAELEQDLQTTADALAEYQQSHRNMEQAHSNQYKILCKRTDEVIVLRAAIEQMRIAGGSAEFQSAFDRAKELL